MIYTYKIDNEEVEESAFYVGILCDLECVYEDDEEEIDNKLDWCKNENSYKIELNGCTYKKEFEYEYDDIYDDDYFMDTRDN